MTQQPDRFEKIAMAICRLGMRQSDLVPRIAEALRSEEQEALDRAAMIVAASGGSKAMQDKIRFASEEPNNFTKEND